ncbi:MAG TPA: ADOP family duplicated permease [Gemmatimonadaceae bacterium]|jgi:predicted permease
MLAHSPYGRAAGGDLDEGFDQLAATSALRATFWYWRRALSIAMHYLPSLLASTADHLVHDGAYAARALRRTPLFTIVATVILALGIGANTAVLGLIDDMYFRKLPVPQPERIVAIYAGDTRNRGRAGTLRDESISLHTFAELRTRIRGVDTLAMYAVHSLPTGDPLSGDETWSALVSGNYFHVLGVAPERGRFIGDDDEQPEGAHPVVVISDYLWREKFAGDEHVIGRQIPIGQVTFTVIGVAPRGFTGLHPEGRTILWMPYTMANALAPRGTASHAPATGSQDTFFGTVFGRLSANATLAQVQASADGAAQDLTANDLTANRHLAFYVRVRDRLTTAELSGNALSMFALAWIMIALLHLVACSNVASLMLARSAARRRELGVRMCLGASRMRILMQSFIEAWLLAILGAGGGLAVGLVFSKLLARMAFLSASNPHLDLRVIAIVALVVGATVVQFGMLPAFDASRTDPLSVLRGGPGRARGVRRDRSEMVVLGQVAVSMTLVANAAVFVALARRQATTSPGYDAAHLAVASVSLRDGLVSPSDQHAAYADALTRVAAVPGVRAATGAVGAPLFNTHWFGAVSTPTSVATSDGASQTSLQAVGPGYFATLGAPLVRGREFTIRDRLPPTAPRDAFDVVVVNESLARRLWPNDDPIGKQISVPGSSSAIVVGIVRDIHDVSTIAAVPRAYVPLLETRFQSFDVVVRTTGPASISVETIRAALQASGELQRPAVRTMSFIQAGAMSTSRAAALGVSICGGLALFLTVVGLYGIVTMWAAQRRAEIGIRLALGATSGNVHWLLLSGVGKLLCTGAALGLFCAFGIVQIERGQIGPIISLDAAAVGISLLVLVACAGAAAYLPSRRATRQHPAEVLRTSI